MTMFYGVNDGTHGKTNRHSELMRHLAPLRQFIRGIYARVLVQRVGQ